MAAQVNSHLIACRDYASCFDVKGNKDLFADWFRNNCSGEKGKNGPPRLDENIALLAVASSKADAPLELLKDKGLYFRLLGEPEGAALWELRGNTRVFILLWNTLDDLKASRPPTLLVGKRTTVSAGEDSSLSGTDTSTVGDFHVFMLDQKQKAANRDHKPLPRPQVIKNEREVEVEYFDWDWCRPNELKTFKEVNDGSSPTYWFYMKIEEVVHPKDGGRVGTREGHLEYLPRDFAASKSGRVPIVRSNGYELDDSDLVHEIRKELKETFRVDLSRAKVLPRTEKTQNLGFREAGHPIYETYLPEGLDRESDSQQKGDLVPDPNWPRGRRPKRVKRVTGFYSNRWKRLCEMWGRDEEER